MSSHKVDEVQARAHRLLLAGEAVAEDDAGAVAHRVVRLGETFAPRPLKLYFNMIIVPTIAPKLYVPAAFLKSAHFVEPV